MSEPYPGSDGAATALEAPVLSDAEIAALCEHDGGRAVSLWIDRYGEALMGYLEREFGRGAGDPDEAFSRTLVDLWRACQEPDWQPEGSMLAWLRTTARRNALDDIAERRRALVESAFRLFARAHQLFMSYSAVVWAKLSSLAPMQRAVLRHDTDEFPASRDDELLARWLSAVRERPTSKAAIYSARSSGHKRLQLEPLRRQRLLEAYAEEDAASTSDLHALGYRS